MLGLVGELPAQPVNGALQRPKGHVKEHVLLLPSKLQEVPFADLWGASTAWLAGGTRLGPIAPHI